MEDFLMKAREVLDSRGNPTVEAEIKINDQTIRAIAPSGASTGKYEALELRDKDDRFHGKGVLKAVNNVEKIYNALKDVNLKDQNQVDEKIKTIEHKIIQTENLLDKQKSMQKRLKKQLAGIQ